MSGLAWWRDDTFWRDIEPFLFSREAYDRADEEVEELLDELELEPGARILDVGCGTGRLLFPLQKRGFQVVGIDVSDRYRQTARMRARNERTEIDVRAVSVWDLPEALPERFDAVIANFAVIGYGDDPISDIHAVQGMVSVLVPGGQLFLQTRNPAQSEGAFQHRNRNGACMEQRQYDPVSRTMRTRWVVTTGGYHREYLTSIRVYSADDLRSLLDLIGLQQIRTLNLAHEERVVAMATWPGFERVPDAPAEGNENAT